MGRGCGLKAPTRASYVLFLWHNLMLKAISNMRGEPYLTG